MKDIIWTLIIVWLIYKVVEVFQSMSKRQTQRSQNFTSPQKPDKPSQRRHLNQEGEYVDFEEMK